MPKVVGIKHKEKGRIYTFRPLDEELAIGTKVVVESSRGKELGIIATLPYEEEEDKLVLPIMPVVRVATQKDIDKNNELNENKPHVIEKANALIKKYNLEMKLVDVNFTLDGQKVVIDFVCEDRVDFRDLVKELASQLKLRIELRQIGIRDQAKAVGGLGICGKECCCSQYLNDFDKVSIKMAKVQGLSLNTAKISGVCGRLMCCLNYEQSTYEDIRKRMPQVGSIVKTEEGTGEVISNNTVKETVRVKYKRAGEEIINDFNIDNIELIEGNYEDSIDDSDIRLEIDSEEDKKFIKALIKDN